MRRLLTLLFLAFFLQGCGDGDGLFEGDSSRRGSGNLGELKDTYWVLKLDDRYAYVVYFKDDGRYIGGILKANSATSGSMMASRGRYEVSGEDITLEADSTTCPEAVEKGKKTWKIGKGIIATTYKSKSIALRKYDGPKHVTSAILTWGCFRDNGTFYEQAWTNL